jgi:integration host factor subunit alpha
MALTKIEIVESIQNQTGFSKNRSSEIVETLLEIIKSMLASGDKMMLPPIKIVKFDYPGN